VQQSSLSTQLLGGYLPHEIPLLLPLELIRRVLQECRCYHQRYRRLSMEWVVLVLVFMAVYRELPIDEILRKVMHACAMYLGKDPGDYPKCNAISYRRQQLSVKAMRELVREVCQPLAQENTRGAFFHGLRMVAIDGHVIQVPDTPKNAHAFGYHDTGRGRSVYPTVQSVFLCEVGTHALIDGIFLSSRRSEHVGAHKMLDSIEAGMLVMWDAGLHDYFMVREVLRKGAHVLARVPCDIHFEILERLPDKSFLAWLYPSSKQRKQLVAKGLIAKGSPRAQERLLVRLMEYTITQEGLPGYGEIHRLLFTLPDPAVCPAHEAAVCYHQRWEMEGALDEVETHQLLGKATLRSKTPRAVLQELYGIWLAHYLERKLIHQAALEADIDPDRISFTESLRLIQDTIPAILGEAALQITSRCCKLSEWIAVRYEWLIGIIKERILPKRRFRSNPRVVKQRNRTKFRAKKPDDYSPPNLIGSFGDVIALI